MAETSSAPLQRIDGSALRFLAVGEVDRPRSLVLLLHGVGADGRDLLGLAHRLAPRLPGALLILPNAPQSYREALDPVQIAAAEQVRPEMDWETSRTWVTTKGIVAGPAASAVDGLHAALEPPVRALNRLCDLLLARHGLSDSALALYGFSQGGMVAIHAGLGRPRACAGVVSHSGHTLGARQTKATPRMLLILGSRELEDGQMMAAIHPITRESLTALGVPFEERICEGLHHGVNEASVEHTAAFLRDVLTIA